MKDPKTKLIDVAPKDVSFLFELNSGAIEALMIITDNMTFNYNKNNPDHVKAEQYLVNVFVPLIEESDRILKGERDVY